MTNAIATIVQAVERSDVDTVMVAGGIRKRAGKLVGVDVAGNSFAGPISAECHPYVRPMNAGAQAMRE